MRLARLSTLLVLATLAPRASAQAPAEATFDLGVRPSAERPLLAELRFELRGTLEASAGDKAKMLGMKHQSRLDFVARYDHRTSFRRSSGASV